VSPYLESLNFDTTRLSARTANLSGGNQQKLMFARWQYSQPKILLVDEPTRGVDIGARVEILEALRRSARDNHIGVLLVSSELEEVIAVSDRILVLAEGRMVGEVEVTEHTSPSDFLHLAFSGARPTALEEAER
jgi:ABC-type sugar transport system ATPase subunit